MTDPISFLISGHSENTEQPCEVGDSTDSKMGMLLIEVSSSEGACNNLKCKSIFKFNHHKVSIINLHVLLPSGKEWSSF